MSKQALNYLLGELERLGYVERLPDPDDLRSRRISVTKRGDAIAAVIREAVGEIEAEWTEKLGAGAVRGAPVAPRRAQRARIASPHATNSRHGDVGHGQVDRTCRAGATRLSGRRYGRPAVERVVEGGRRLRVARGSHGRSSGRRRRPDALRLRHCLEPGTLLSALRRGGTPERAGRGAPASGSRSRTTNDYGKSDRERELILQHIAEVEPLLRANLHA